MNSIRRQLLLWLALGLSAGILLAGIALYFQARGEANEIFDYQMRQIAASLPRQAFAPIAPGQALPGMDDEIMMQIWDSTGTVIYHSHARSVMPQQAELGFVNVPGPGGGVARVQRADRQYRGAGVAAAQRTPDGGGADGGQDRDAAVAAVSLSGGVDLDRRQPWTGAGAARRR